MSYHLIVGFGKWSKKNLDYLRNKNKLKNIVIKTRNKFIYPNHKVLSKIDTNKKNKKIDTIHICTPVESHFAYLKKFKHLNKIFISYMSLESNLNLFILGLKVIFILVLSLLFLSTLI